MTQHILLLKTLAFLISIFTVLSFFISNGCSTTTLMHPASDEEMNEKLKGLDAIVQLKDGRQWGVKDVKVSKDSASWLNRSTNNESGIALEQLSKITTINKDHVLGALEGLGIGFVGVGLPIWALFGFSTESGGSPSGIPGALDVVKILGAAGGGIGLIIGVLSGFTYYDEFQVDERNVFKSDSLKSPSR